MAGKRGKKSRLQREVRLDVHAPKSNKGLLLIALASLLIVLTAAIVGKMSPYSPTKADVTLTAAVAGWKPSGCVGPARWDGIKPDQCERGVHSHQIQLSERVEPGENIVAYVRVHGLDAEERLVHIYVNDANSQGYKIVKSLNGREPGWEESTVMPGRSVEVAIPIKADKSGNFSLRVQSPKTNGDSVFVEPVYYRSDSMPPRQTQACTPGDADLQPTFELTNEELQVVGGVVVLRTMVTEMSRVNYFYIEGYDATDGWVQLTEPLLWETQVMQEIFLGPEGSYSQYRISGYNSGEACVQSVNLVMGRERVVPSVTLKPGKLKPTIEVPPPGYDL